MSPSEMRPRRALLIDDLAPARAWLRVALHESFGSIELREAGSVAEALRQLQDFQPDLALVDLGLPDGSGVRIIESLQASAPECLCVVSTVFDDDAHVFPALRAGAQGYVLKDQPSSTLARMLRGILDGQPPLSPSIARRLLRQFQHSTSEAPGPIESMESQPAQESLTPRETEVLQLIAKGYTVQQTAAALGLSPHTASGYVKDIYRKLSVRSRAEATLEAARRGLVTRA